MYLLDRLLQEISCYDKNFAHLPALLYIDFKKSVALPWWCLSSVSVQSTLSRLNINCLAVHTKMMPRQSHLCSHSDFTKLTSTYSTCFFVSVHQAIRIAPYLGMHNFYWWLNVAGILDASPCCGSITTLSTKQICMECRNASLNTHSIMCLSMLMAALILLLWSDACYTWHNITEQAEPSMLTVGVKIFPAVVLTLFLVFGVVLFCFVLQLKLECCIH